MKWQKCMVGLRSVEIIERVRPIIHIDHSFEKEKKLESSWPIVSVAEHAYRTTLTFS